MYKRNAAAHLDHHFMKARRLAELGRHGHSHELEFRNLNLHINTFSQRRHLEEDMLKHAYHEEHLSHDELVRQQTCIVGKIMDSGMDEDTDMDPQKQRRKLSTTAKPCRTPYEKCIDNALSHIKMDPEDHDSGNRHRHQIWEAAEACNHLSSVSKHHMARHRRRQLDTTAVHMNHKLHLVHNHDDEQPITWGKTDLPSPDELHAWLLKKWPQKDSHSNEMRHCIMHKATHDEWHDKHGADNPHSLKLAEVQCWHDTYGMYSRVHPLHALISHKDGTMSLPHVAHPRQSRKLMAREIPRKQRTNIDAEITAKGDLMLKPDNLPSMRVVQNMFFKYDKDNSSSLDADEAKRLCDGQDLCRTLADLWKITGKSNEENKPMPYSAFEVSLREAFIHQSGIRNHIPSHFDAKDSNSDGELDLHEFRELCRELEICDVTTRLPPASALFQKGLDKSNGQFKTLNKATLLALFEEQLVPSAGG